MIVDNLNLAELYEGLHKDFKAVFEVLRKMLAGEITEKVVLDEGNVWVNPPAKTTIAPAPRFYEAHRDFIDIHCILTGAETFGYANIDRLETVKTYDQADDYLLLDGKGNTLTLNAGDFCITFPQDAHLPAFAKVEAGELVRVVAKIRV